AGDLRVSRHGALAAAAHRCQKSAFSGHSLERVEVIQPFAKFGNSFIVSANLNSDGCLSNAREHHAHVQHRGEQAVGHGVSVQSAVGLDGEIEPRDAGQGEDGAVEFAAVRDFLHASRYVATNLDHA